MLLSLVLHIYSMRYLLPAAVLLGSAPTYVLVWGAWRLLSALLPVRFYQRVDDHINSVYQSMVVFFFEQYTGAQVSGPVSSPVRGAPDVLVLRASGGPHPQRASLSRRCRRRGAGTGQVGRAFGRFWHLLQEGGHVGTGSVCTHKCAFLRIA